MPKLFVTCYHEDGLGESSRLSMLAMAALVLFVVVGASYAAYLFIDATHIADLSGIHITKNLSLAASDLKGNLYNNPENGVKNWLVYRDENNHYEIKYPNDWEIKKDDKSLFNIRLSNKQSNGQSSIGMVVSVGKLIVADGDDFAKVVADNEQEPGPKNLEQEDMNGKTIIHTKKHREESGIDEDAYYWKMDGSVLYLQANYYNANSTDFETLFNKIVGGFKVT